MSVTSAGLKSLAAERSGLDDFGDDWFEQPLALFVDDINDGLLNERGKAFMQEQAVRDLMRRLRVLDFLERHPEIDDVEIPPIVYVAGQIRSGTTLLHNLLAQHELARPMLRWELMEPLPPPEAATYATDPRIAKIQASIDKRRGTQLEQMHWVNADEPEECQWAFIDVVSILAGAASACMRRWGKFVNTADMTPVFENYRRILKLLLWRNPPPDNGFLVLKAPQITQSIAEFAAVFPEARFVIPARDPYRVVVSGSTMIGGVVEPLVDRSKWSEAELVGTSTDIIEGTIRGMLDFDDDPSSSLLVLRYPDLVDDPVGTAARVYAELDRPADEALASKIAAFIDGQRTGGRAAPPASLPDWGLDPDEVRRRPAIAEFCSRYGIEPERRRLTGTSP